MSSTLANPGVLHPDSHLLSIHTYLGISVVTLPALPLLINENYLQA